MASELGDFLRARRGLVSPAEVGLPAATGSRRVPGLRREEVAALAAISVEYYTRLERGRDRAPSVQVLSAVADVLQLDAEAIAYMTALAGLAAPRTDSGPVDEAPTGLVQLLNSLSVPAIILNPYSDVLAANQAAEVLSPGLRAGTNRLRWEFTTAEAPAADPNWLKTTEVAVAHLRAQASLHPTDPRLLALVAELSAHSSRFRELWARHDVRNVRGGPVVIRHPHVGHLTFRAEKFFHSGDAGAQLLTLQPDPGTATERLLAQLMARNGLADEC